MLCSTEKGRAPVQGAGEPAALALAEEQGGSYHNGRRAVAPAGPDAAGHPQHPPGLQPGERVGTAPLLLQELMGQ